MDLVLSLMMLAALALAAGAAFLWLKRGARKQAALMLVLAVVLLANVAIWTLPYANGDAPLGRADALAND